MNTIYDGGPANPFGDSTGITIRDYFATAIMTGVYSAGAQATVSVEDAYRAADAMLAMRLVALPAIVQPVATPVIEPVATPVVQPVEETPVEEAVADPTV